jgi:predicted metal-dependent hydrolase
MLREEKLVFNNKEYLLKIYVERRRSTYMSIGRNINIRVPKFFSEKAREEQINNMKLKLIDYLKKDPDKYAPISLRKYVSGEIIDIFDRKYILTIQKENRKTSLAKIKENQIILKIPNNLLNEDKIISKLIGKILSKELLPLLKDKVNFFNDLYFKQNIKSIFLKNNTSKFGSCSYDKKLVFSTSLLLARKDVIDYVIIHELCHTIHHNHSKRFWKLVEKFVPDHKEKSKWLRENRAKLII